MRPTSPPRRPRRARADTLALRLAEQAAAAVEEARQAFARAHEGTTNLEFYYRTRDLKAAEDMVERRLAISGREAETEDTAAAYGNLGLIYRTRGELDVAEEMFRKALAIFSTSGRAWPTLAATSGFSNAPLEIRLPRPVYLRQDKTLLPGRNQHRRLRRPDPRLARVQWYCDQGGTPSALLRSGLSCWERPLLCRGRHRAGRHRGPGIGRIGRRPRSFRLMPPGAASRSWPGGPGLAVARVGAADLGVLRGIGTEVALDGLAGTRYPYRGNDSGKGGDKLTGIRIKV